MKDKVRIIIGCISIAFILYMWIKKDILSIYATLPSEQVLPAIVTTVAVSLFKVLSIAIVILFIKKILKR